MILNSNLQRRNNSELQIEKSQQETTPLSLSRNSLQFTDNEEKAGES